MSTGAKVGLVVGAIAGVVVLLVAVVALLGSSDTGKGAVPVTEVVPESFVHVEDPDGEFALDLHPAWVGVSLRGDVEGAGARTAPDDPERAAAIDNVVAAVPRELVFVALDGEVLGQDRFVPNINLDPVPRRGATIDEYEVGIPHNVEAFGATDAEVERVTTSEGEGLRMTYRFSGAGALAGVEGRQYYFFAEDTVWILTLTSDDMVTDAEHFDDSASSFTLR
jgi:hypothetical protein